MHCEADLTLPRNCLEDNQDIHDEDNQDIHDEACSSQFGDLFRELFCITHARINQLQFPLVIGTSTEIYDAQATLILILYLFLNVFIKHADGRV